MRSNEQLQASTYNLHFAEARDQTLRIRGCWIHSRFHGAQPPIQEARFGDSSVIFSRLKFTNMFCFKCKVALYVGTYLGFLEYLGIN